MISEYPPGSEAVGPNGFLQRNRLIAALSSALLVVEAQEKSGTMSTVSHAERYGKPVFAVPGSIYSPNWQAQTACCGTAARGPCVLLLTCGGAGPAQAERSGGDGKAAGASERERAAGACRHRAAAPWH